MTLRALTVSAATLALLGANPPGPALTSGAWQGAPDSGTIRVHFLGHAIGSERYTIRRDGEALALTDTFAYTDRGGLVRLNSSMRLTPTLEPLHLRAQGHTYRFVNLDADVTVQGTQAHVRNLGDSVTMPVPRAFFAIAGYAPLVAQALLVRYWEIHGRPATIVTAPANPTTTVTIERRGRDTTLRVGGRALVVRRYSIGGVAWGRETIWLDDENRFVGIVTRANMLPIEGVREDVAEALPTLQREAIADQLADLQRAQRAMPPLADGSFALVGGRIIDGTSRPPLADGVVLVRDGRIAAVGPRQAVAVPAGVRTIDVRGKTIIPGLWDMHTHVELPEWGAAYLGVGVTTVRDMGGEMGFLVAFRDALAAGRGLGPRLLLAGLVDGSGPAAFGTVWADTPDEGRRVVEAYHAAGFQQMKLYTYVAPDVAGAIIRRAHELGMTVTGHVPRAMTLEAMVDSGADNVAHLPIRGDTASATVRRQIALLAAHHFVVDPTISWNELLGHANETPITSFQPGFAEAPWPIVAAYGSVRNSGDSATINRGTRAQLAVVNALHDAGVRIVAGTDYGLPGFSLLREIELYVEAGFTPLEAIRSATVVPADVMGLSADVGTIELGKRADLLVLDRNPLDDIHNIRTGHWVVANGRMYDCSAMRRSVGFTPAPKPAGGR